MNSIVITGGTGFLGQRLVANLLERGDRVVVLTRRANDPRVPARAEQVMWSPDRAGPWASALEGASAVVHLAGEPLLGPRWSPEQKRRIRDSRVVSTRVLVDAMRGATQRPRAFVCASAVGYYGPRDAAEELDETSAAGEGFVADVVKQWEHEASKASELGVRTAMLRIGIVLGESGGALAQMLTPFRLFVGGPVGSGRQVLSWVHIDDALAITTMAIDRDDAAGPINVTAPRPVDMNEFARALGRVMGRPAWLRAPSFALKVAMGGAAEVVLTGQRVLPKAAQRLGHAFRFSEVEGALRDALSSR